MNFIQNKLRMKVCFIDRLNLHKFIVFFFIVYWYKEADVYVLCGNSSGSRKCPKGYVCWKDLGKK